MTDNFETLAEAWEWTQSPAADDYADTPDSPEQALALLMAYAGGIPGEYVAYEDGDEVIKDLGKNVWNTLRRQQEKIGEQREYLRESTQAEIEMMQRSLREHQAIQEIIRKLDDAQRAGEIYVDIVSLVTLLKEAINYRKPPEGRRRSA